MKRIVNIRLIFFAALAFGGGIFLGSFFYGDGYKPLGIALAAALPVAACTIVLGFRRLAAGRLQKAAAFFRKYRASFVVFLLFAVLGMGAFQFAAAEFERDCFGATKGSVTGRVTRADVRDGVAVLTLEKVELTAMGVTVRLKGNTLLTVTGDTMGGVDVGDWLTSFGRIYGNPLKRDETIDGYSYKHNLRYSMRADFCDTLAVPGAKTTLETMRQGLYRMLLKNMAPDLAGTAYAMMMGDVSYIPSDSLGNFRAAGISHVFAVSGLHVGFLVGAVDWLMKKLRQNPAARLVVVFGVLAFYVSLTGLSGSVLRASVMILTLYAARVFGERYDALTGLGTAFLITLFAAPLYLFEAGFLMSYSVMLSLIALSAPLTRFFSRRGNAGFLSRAAASSVAAEIGIVPVSVATFHTFNPFGVVVNVLFIPLTGVMFTSLLVFSLLTAIAPFCGFLLKIPELMIFASALLAGTVAAIPYAEIALYSFSGFAVFYYLALFFGSRIFLVKGRAKRLLCLFAAVCFAGGVTLWETVPVPPREDALTLFGTEYQQNALLETGTGERILINSAPSYHCGNVTEFFAERRIKRLNAVVIPSLKARYLDTLALVSESCKVDSVYLPFSDSPADAAAYDLIEANGIEVRFLAPGELKIGNAEFTVFFDREAFAFGYKSLLYCCELSPGRVAALLRESGEYTVVKAEESLMELALAFRPEILLSHRESAGVSHRYKSAERYGAVRVKIT